MPEPIRSDVHETHEQKMARIKRALRASRKDSADKWITIYDQTDPFTGVRQELFWNAETEEVKGRRSDTRLAQHLDQNKDEFVETMNRTGKVPSMRKIASIPMATFMDNFQTPYVERDWTHINKMLNDPDNAKLRTHRGRV